MKRTIQQLALLVALAGSCAIFEYRRFEVAESAPTGCRIYEESRFVHEALSGGMLEANDFIDRIYEPL
jgi:hypothetical protein